MAKGLVGHDRTEVGAADADVHHVTNGLTGVAEPLPASNSIGEVGHAIKDLVYFSDDVHPVNNECRVSRQAKRGVQDGPVLGNVDVLAGEHGVAA